MVFKVCVFCGSKEGVDPAHKALAQAFGVGLATRGMPLVYGGGEVGIMGVLSDAVLDAGGTVTGIIPKFLMEWEVGNLRCTDLIQTDSMHSRKQLMADMADVFVTLPGGIGSIDETIEIITWKQLRLHTKPIIVLNQGGYWQPMLDMLSATVDGGFTSKESLGLFDVADDLAALWKMLERAKPSA